MQNDAGEVVDVYIPRKWYHESYKKYLLLLFCCSAYTQRIISAKDHASVQINVAEVTIT